MERAFLHRDGRIHDLGSLGGTKSFPASINNSRQIVGYSYTDKGEIRAFLYQKGQMFDLNRLIAPSKYSILESAHFINERGDIVATAIDAHGKRYVVRLRRTGRT